MERGGVGDSETKAARDGRAIIGVSFAASRRQAFHLLRFLLQRVCEGESREV